MNPSVFKILVLLLTAFMVTVPTAVAGDQSTTVSLYVPPPPSPADIESEILISATDAVRDSGGYTVNDDLNPTRIVLNGYGGLYQIEPVSLPPDTTMKIIVTYHGRTDTIYWDFFHLSIPQHDSSLLMNVNLDFCLESDVPTDDPDTPSSPDSPDSPVTPDDPDTPSSPDSPDTPVTPDDPDTPSSPDSPDTPVTPDNPNTPGSPDNPGTPVTPGTPSTPVTPSTPDVPVNPDTPVNPSTPVTPDTPSTPGTDEPYVPILPPAGSVYNFAGFIPLVAGFLLLFLVFFWRRKVYRILKSYAKKHGEKPEKEHLKEIADAIIKLVRDEGRYPEWKKNSDVAKRLSADIVSVLDEMNYARAVPRGAVAAEILKAAKGRINRHRL